MAESSDANRHVSRVEESDLENDLLPPVLIKTLQNYDAILHKSNNSGTVSYAFSNDPESDPDLSKQASFISPSAWMS